MTDVNLHIGRRLRCRRRLLGLTQQELATATGITFQQINKYEQATNRMSAARVYEMARALDVPVSYFFAGLDEREGIH
jgi:transcriptional regulator with XRE-family HTH domain